MTGKLRKLNDEGIERFHEYLRDGADGRAPVHLLDNPQTSEPLPVNMDFTVTGFPNRYVFGNRLNSLLGELNATEIAHDKGLWSGLALLWFDFICPRSSGGKRKVDKEYRYILSSDYRHYYRHLVRSPWQLVRDHGKNARFLLISPRESRHPIAVHGEILEQFGGRQQVLASPHIIQAANSLYLDLEKDRPKTGAAGSGRGSARRFGMVLRQFDLTFDPACMSQEELIDLLPPEFDRWK